LFNESTIHSSDLDQESKWRKSFLKFVYDKFVEIILQVIHLFKNFNFFKIK